MIGAADAVCPLDLAARVGVTVRTEALPSLEGMYAADVPPTILLSAQRPAGRRRFTCAHELGHHVFNHGTRLDELAVDEFSDNSPEEFLANRFAAALLMPKLAVESAFARRAWSTRRPVAQELFVVSQDLGVGYTTLITHMERTLGCIAPSLARKCERVPLRHLRFELAGFVIDADLVVVDEYWGARAVDVEVDDVILLPTGGTFTGECAGPGQHATPHLRATAPGQGFLNLPTRLTSIPVRVSRRNFAGLSRYRHLEECADEQ